MCSWLFVFLVALLVLNCCVSCFYKLVSTALFEQKKEGIVPTSKMPNHENTPEGTWCLLSFGMGSWSWKTCRASCWWAAETWRKGFNWKEWRRTVQDFIKASWVSVNQCALESAVGNRCSTGLFGQYLPGNPFTFYWYVPCTSCYPGVVFQSLVFCEDFRIIRASKSQRLWNTIWHLFLDKVECCGYYWLIAS